MHTVEECLHFAERCERALDKTTAPKQRETLMTLARIWRQLAEEKARQPRSDQAA